MSGSTGGTVTRINAVCATAAVSTLQSSTRLHVLNSTSLTDDLCLMDSNSSSTSTTNRQPIAQGARHRIRRPRRPSPPRLDRSLGPSPRAQHRPHSARLCCRSTRAPPRLAPTLTQADPALGGTGTPRQPTLLPAFRDGLPRPHDAYDRHLYSCRRLQDLPSRVCQSRDVGNLAG